MEYKSYAEALTKATPEHAGKSAYPPQSWRVEGNDLIVLCADGRKLRAALNDIKKLLPAERAKPAHPGPIKTR